LNAIRRVLTRFDLMRSFTTFRCRIPHLSPHIWSDSREFIPTISTPSDDCCCRWTDRPPPTETGHGARRDFYPPYARHARLRTDITHRANAVSLDMTGLRLTKCVVDGARQRKKICIVLGETQYL